MQIRDLWTTGTTGTLAIVNLARLARGQTTIAAMGSKERALLADFGLLSADGSLPLPIAAIVCLVVRGTGLQTRLVHPTAAALTAAGAGSLPTIRPRPRTLTLEALCLAR